MVRIRHSTVVSIPDDGASAVGTNEWNDDHVIEGLTVADVAGALNRAGDAMTGLLTLSGPPTAPLHAATKAYVDAVAGTATGTVTKVNGVSPDVSGNVVLAASNVGAVPTSDKGAANGVATLDAGQKLTPSQAPQSQPRIITASYTFTAADFAPGDQIIYVNSPDQVLLTIPAGLQPKGMVRIGKMGTGEVQIIGGGGVTVFPGAPRITATINSPGTELARIVPVSADTWFCDGGISQGVSAFQIWSTDTVDEGQMLSVAIMVPDAVKALTGGVTITITRTNGAASRFEQSFSATMAQLVAYSGGTLAWTPATGGDATSGDLFIAQAATNPVAFCMYPTVNGVADGNMDVTFTISSPTAGSIGRASTTCTVVDMDAITDPIALFNSVPVTVASTVTSGNQIVVTGANKAKVLRTSTITGTNIPTSPQRTWVTGTTVAGNGDIIMTLSANVAGTVSAGATLQVIPPGFIFDCSKDTGSGGLVTVSGGKVTQIADRVNGYTLTQGNVARQRTWTPNIVGTHGGLTGTGSLTRLLPGSTYAKTVTTWTPGSNIVVLSDTTGLAAGMVCDRWVSFQNTAPGSGISGAFYNTDAAACYIVSVDSATQITMSLPAIDPSSPGTITFWPTTNCDPIVSAFDFDRSGSTVIMVLRQDAASYPTSDVWRAQYAAYARVSGGSTGDNAKGLIVYHRTSPPYNGSPEPIGSASSEGIRFDDARGKVLSTISISDGPYAGQWGDGFFPCRTVRVRVASDVTISSAAGPFVVPVDSAEGLREGMRAIVCSRVATNQGTFAITSISGNNVTSTSNSSLGTGILRAGQEMQFRPDWADRSEVKSAYGREFILGAGDLSNGNTFNGAIMWMMVVARALTAEEMFQVQRYLAGRYVQTLATLTTTAATSVGRALANRTLTFGAPPSTTVRGCRVKGTGIQPNTYAVGISGNTVILNQPVDPDGGGVANGATITFTTCDVPEAKRINLANYRLDQAEHFHVAPKLTVGNTLGSGWRDRYENSYYPAGYLSYNNGSEYEAFIAVLEFPQFAFYDVLAFEGLRAGYGHGQMRLTIALMTPEEQAIHNKGTPGEFAYKTAMLQGRWTKTGMHRYREGRLWPPGGRSMWNALWTDSTGGSWPHEIDILEQSSRGFSSVMISQGLHFNRMELEDPTFTHTTASRTFGWGGFVGEINNRWARYGHENAADYHRWYFNGMMVAECDSACVEEFHDSSYPIITAQVSKTSWQGAPDYTMPASTGTRQNYLIDNYLTYKRALPTISIGGGTDAATTAWSAACSVAPTAGRIALMDTFIKTLKAIPFSFGGTLWDNIVYLGLHATHDSTGQAALINVKNPAQVGVFCVDATVTTGISGQAQVTVNSTAGMLAGMTLHADIGGLTAGTVSISTVNNSTTLTLSSNIFSTITPGSVIRFRRSTWLTGLGSLVVDRGFTGSARAGGGDAPGVHIDTGLTPASFGAPIYNYRHSVGCVVSGGTVNGLQIGSTTLGQVMGMSVRNSPRIDIYASSGQTSGSSNAARSISQPLTSSAGHFIYSRNTYQLHGYRNGELLMPNNWVVQAVPLAALDTATMRVGGMSAGLVLATHITARLCEEDAENFSTLAMIPYLQAIGAM